MATIKNSGGGSEHALMSQIATGIVADKVVADVASSLSSNPQANDFEEDEEVLASWRRQRMEEMKVETERLRHETENCSHGEYMEISQDEFLPAVTRSKFVVCHFYHKDFQRCKLMDTHLRTIAPLHPETRFVTINAEKAPFFVTKLGIKVLPTLLLFQDGVCYDRVLGFDGVSTRDVFPTVLLAKKLVALGVMKVRHREEEHEESEDSDDFDD
mmetsp:Transcript_3069/g.6351  ORF Transcript_3069/g.6351 Transcript_3069/m.6351 type:complete len:214 (-) Transcript_3069:30-671(-)|eukprot:CAMPEP_0204906072 /NCGR_PEP_ID=MMETSP1397-20131031/5782_1 /ASSEMBLY_ACC=CAM_ASM_000891 /TAXON_ID=49980 /ORGANISM="Climacostomum Climacostomum virens, Strain Stock W-24" /LENGTH=213 /DNA_ID=CAMNT_0052075045 /DNA_START=249 /DNA_END=890 /DNA_ORIENTATION=-